MNINIQTVHFDADEKLLDFVHKKVEKLATFHDRITRVEVFLKLDNLVHAIKDKVVEIKIHIPKQDCFVKSTSKSFESSFDHAFDSVINQLKKKNSQHNIPFLKNKERPKRAFFCAFGHLFPPFLNIF